MAEVFKLISAETIDAILPSKEPVSSRKLIAKNDEQILCYYLMDNPILFMIRNALFPTVYLTMSTPNLQMDRVVTSANAFDHLMNGADMMLPGVRNESSELYLRLKVNDLVLITLNESAIDPKHAVAYALVDADYIAKNGFVGKGFKVVHVVNDELYNSGNKKLYAHLQINPAVMPKETVVALTEQSTPSFIDMDLLIEDSFYYSLLKDVKDSDLPLEYSVFMNRYLVPNRRVNTTHCVEVDVSKTKYKKLSKFMDAMCDKGIIAVREPVKGAFELASINRNHPDLLSFSSAGYKSQKKVDAANQLEANKLDTLNNKIKVSEYVQLGRKTAFLLYQFEANSGNTMVQQMEKGLYRPEIKAKTKVEYEQYLFKKTHLRSLLNTYITNNSLADPQDPTMVGLDATLLALLPKPSSSEQPPLDRLKRDAIIKRLDSDFKDYYTITRGQHEIVRKGTSPKVTIAEKAILGKKSVTKVMGLDLFDIDEVEFAKNVVSTTSSSSTITPMKGNIHANEVQVQGRHANKIQAFIEKEYGLALKHIQIQ